MRDGSTQLEVVVHGNDQECGVMWVVGLMVWAAGVEGDHRETLVLCTSKVYKGCGWCQAGFSMESGSDGERGNVCEGYCKGLPRSDNVYYRTCGD